MQSVRRLKARQASAIAEQQHDGVVVQRAVDVLEQVLAHLFQGCFRIAFLEQESAVGERVEATPDVACFGDPVGQSMSWSPGRRLTRDGSAGSVP
jgi:hypothetical protein